MTNPIAVLITGIDVVSVTLPSYSKKRVDNMLHDQYDVIIVGQPNAIISN